MARCSQGRCIAAYSPMLLLLLLLVSFHTSSAVTYNVGDRVGWSLPGINYNRWAASKRFRINDFLRFSYSSGIHNVEQVSKVDFDRCSAARPLASYSDGNSAVRLSRQGTYYFICGVPGHCQSGMKMQVTVS